MAVESKYTLDDIEFKQEKIKNEQLQALLKALKENTRKRLKTLLEDDCYPFIL